MIYESMHAAAPPDLRAWLDAHRAEVEAAALAAAPKLIPPTPGTLPAEPAARALRPGDHGDVSAEVYLGPGGVWAMQSAPRPDDRWLIQPYGITISGAEARALPGEWVAARHDAGRFGMGTKVVLLDAGDGRGPLPRVAKEVKGIRWSLEAKIGRQVWHVSPSEDHPEHLTMLLTGGNAARLSGGAGWEAKLIDAGDAPRRSVAKLSAGTRAKVDGIVLRLLARGQADAGMITTALIEPPNVHTEYDTPSDAWTVAANVATAEERDAMFYRTRSVVDNALVRLERAGKIHRGEWGWISNSGGR